MKAVVIGLGYVGLPLAIRLTQIGHKVIAIDKDVKKVELLKNEKLPFAPNEPNLDNFFQKAVKTGNIEFTSTYKEIKNARIIFVCVDTPVINRKPFYRSLLFAAESIAKNLGEKQVIVLESTMAPKTTEKEIIPMIEKLSKKKLNKDFFIAVAPERIRPNFIFKQLTTLPRIVGVSTKNIIPQLRKIYPKITSGGIDFTNIITAETAKTVENTYRDVQIAFANEIALACEELGVNVWEVRELVNKDPFKDIHKPGAGVGGHCIPKDPWLLVSSLTKTSLTIPKNARMINDSMPKHMYDLLKVALQAKKIRSKSAKVAVLGYSYAPESDDTRNSPTEQLINFLKKGGITFRVHDPFVKEYQSIQAKNVIAGSDAVIVMVDHSAYSKMKLEELKKIMRNRIIVDGRNTFNKEKAQNLGFIYKGVGNV